MSKNILTKLQARKSGGTGSSGTRHNVQNLDGDVPSSNDTVISSSTRLVKCLPRSKSISYQRNIGAPPPSSREDYMLMVRDWVEGVSASVNYAIPSARHCPHNEFVPCPLPRLRRYKTQSALGKRPQRTPCVNDSADEADVESEIEARKKIPRYYESDSDASLPTVESEQDFDGPTTPRDATPAHARVHIATISPPSDRWQVSWERVRSDSGIERALSPVPAEVGFFDESDVTVPSWTTLEQELEEIDEGTKV
ncbi:hypothetical protein CYLTODRAFT_459706 [Cylindrobasidium torrendii FP15055 ss-10]|uniref:Uncharacterized protein n=1 Tax=Cylindrobasidium torrendii FP15055 ss-10 TaxID=1314674 RepID=A0A0D7ATD7_9AGAR|nr:hypothetical protein CYLTODRAFT_459706 [Cylindrobasidium torrendii FP15055 ss-10]